MADSRVRWSWLVWAGLALVAIGYWAAQAAALQAGYERFRRDAGTAWSDGGTAFVWAGLGPGLEIKEPSFTLDLGGRQVSWRAANALLHGVLPGRGHTATARLQRVRTAAGEIRIDGTGMVFALGTSPRLQANVLLLGTPPGQVQMRGLWVEWEAGTLVATADSLGAAPFGEHMAGERLVARVGAPGGLVQPGGTIPLHTLKVEWGGAGLAASGTFGLDDAGWPVFAGTAALTGHAGALDRLVRAGALTVDAARAVNAVLDIHSAAKPPAPLKVMFGGGVLTAAGFPVWRAE